MLLIQDYPVDIPALPASWSPSEAGSSKLSPPTKRTLIPVGLQYHRHAQRAIHQRTFDDDDKLRNEEFRKALEASSAMNENGTDNLGIGDEPESAELLASDPKEWKKLDQYAVLGLSSLRYKATIDQIRVAHRKKVLKHHPDKKANQKGDSNDDAFFKCISKALEVLTNPERRRQFDSIDPYFQDLEDNQVPTSQAINGAKDPVKAFFNAFTPIYQREARFCKDRPESEVPGLGTYQDSKQTVEAFYDFWYNFDSWRSFEWFDKEVNEGSDNRDDKRYTEKKNKTERARRKKEDNARLRLLVDQTLQLDPRIKRIKQEEKEERERKKKGRSGAASGTATPVKTPQQKAEEEKAAKEAAAKKEEEEKAAKEDAKKAKAAAANAAKKARRAARATEGS